MNARYPVLFSLLLMVVLAFSVSAFDTASAQDRVPFQADGAITVSDDPITPDNVMQVEQLAMFGRGLFNAAAFRPDGRLLVTGGNDGVIRLWGIPAN